MSNFETDKQFLMTEFEKDQQYFIAKAKEKPVLKNDGTDMIYVGSGGAILLKYFKWEVFTLENVKTNYWHSWLRTSADRDYYTPKSIWESVLKLKFDDVMTPPKKVYTIADAHQQLAEARKLVGKKVTVDEKTLIVCSANLYADPSEKHVAENTELRNKQGFIVILEGSGFYSFYSSYDPENPPKIVEDSVFLEVAGHKYEGKYNTHSGIWKFGCAQIHKQTVYDCLQSINSSRSLPSSFKSIEKIQIGKGMFDFETISKMFEIQSRS